MSRRPPTSTRTATRVPYTALFRSPFVAALVAGVLLRTPPVATQATGLVVGLLGTLAVSRDQLGEGDNAWLGVVMALGATVCYRSEEPTSQLQSLMRL